MLTVSLAVACLFYHLPVPGLSVSLSLSASGVRVPGLSAFLFLSTFIIRVPQLSAPFTTDLPIPGSSAPPFSSGHLPVSKSLALQSPSASDIICLGRPLSLHLLRLYLGLPLFHLFPVICLCLGHPLRLRRVCKCLSYFRLDYLRLFLYGYPYRLKRLFQENED